MIDTIFQDKRSFIGSGLLSVIVVAASFKLGNDLSALFGLAILPGLVVTQGLVELQAFLGLNFASGDLAAPFYAVVALLCSFLFWWIVLFGAWMTLRALKSHTK